MNARQLATMPGPAPLIADSTAAAFDDSEKSAAKMTDIAGPAASGDLIVKRDTTLAAPGGFTSAVADSSVGSLGQVLFHTFNWYAAASTNNGSSWSYINPFTTFPTTGAFAGGFCCNQRVSQDPSRNLVFWSLQYIKTNNTATGTNGIRIAVAHGAADVGSNTWQVHDFTPGDFGAAYAQGHWLDYPGLAVSSNYLYFSYNIFRTTDDGWVASAIGRVPLQALNDNTSFTLNTFVTTSPQAFTLTPVTGATTKMFFGAVSTSSSITVLEWAESATNPISHTVGGLNPTYFVPMPGITAPSCPAFDGTNPCTNADTRMQTGWLSSTELGFAWASSQNAAASRPYPFVRVAILNPNAPTSVLSQPDLFNANHAYLYPALSVNARGHAGGVVDALGGSQGSNVASTLVALVRDNYSGGSWSTLALGTSSSGTLGRWGHYNGAATHDQYRNTWVVGGKLQLNSTADENSRVHNIWIMRERDDPFPFTDDPIVATLTLVKAVHVTELRARIDAARAERGLGAFAWSTTITAGATTILASHVVEMREALRQAYVAAGATPPVYSDSSLTAGMTIRAVHVTELRSNVLTLQQSIP
jgi:hypothetical protein